MSYLEKTQQLHELLSQGKDYEALDQFFHQDVLVTEKPTGEQRHGVDAQKKAVEEWMNSVEEMHGSGTKSITANEEAKVTTAETWVEFSMPGMPKPVRMEEVTVYRWEGDKITTMDFYYHNPMAVASEPAA